MAKYNLKGGGVIEADNYSEVVDRLREKSFNPEESKMDYVRRTAEACKIQTGAIIRATNYQVFVKDLIDNGFLEKI